ncbi:sulfotransferase domain-containing protein [uncultured Cyclobacterium sp.]|uniref:sulfotransferase domain-containing protein n=1 Tax=uncultured Cyclobacterium sp. TaxID=453820 RepID=UPI0030ED8C94|tara:strand:- start:7559 stop:8458 length:900 start_codon:yes stop_codon:yes gene_type:complete
MAWKIQINPISCLFKDKTGNNSRKSRPKENIEVETIFIISAGRSGTRFFQDFFNTCFSQVYAVHEPQPDFFDMGMQKIRTDLLFDVSRQNICEFRRPLLKQVLSTPKTTYIESNPHAAYLIPELMATFSSIKFLYVVRNPIDSVRSFYAKSPKDSGGEMLFYGENDHRKRICPKDFPGDGWEKEWPDFNRVHKIAWYWNKVNSIIQESLKNSENSIQIKYEDFFSKNQSIREKTILRVMEFLKLTEKRDADWNKINRIMNQRSNATKVEYLPPFDQWPIKEKEMFKMLTKEMRIKLNYK